MAKPYNRNNTQDDRENSSVDVQRVVDHLSHAFSVATHGMGRAFRERREGSNVLVPNELYKLQTEFCYMIDNIMRGPRYIAPKVVADCNEFIAKISNSRQ